MMIRCFCLILLCSSLGLRLQAQKTSPPYSLAQLDSLVIALREAQALDDMAVYVAQGLQLTKQTTDTFRVKFIYQQAYLLAKKQDYRKADSLNQLALELQAQYHPNWPKFPLRLLFQSANCLSDQGQNEAAKKLLLQALNLKKEEDLEYTKILNNLGIVCTDLAQYAEAEKYHQKAYQLRSQLQGPADPSTARSLKNLANLYRLQGQYPKAIQTYRNVLAIYEKAGQQKDLDYLTTLENLAIALEENGNYEQTEALFLQILQLKKELLGEQHLEYAKAESNLASFYLNTGQYHQAQTLFRSAWIKLENSLGSAHPHTQILQNNLAQLYTQQGQYAQAQALYEQVLATRRSQLGEKHPLYLNVLYNIGVFFSEQQKYPQALDYFQQAQKGYAQHFGKEHPQYAAVLNSLAKVYEGMGDLPQAQSLNLQALSLFEKGQFAQSPQAFDIRNDLLRLAWAARDLNRFDELAHQNLSLNAGLSLGIQPTEAWLDSLRKVSFQQLDPAIGSLQLLFERLAPEQKQARRLVVEAVLDLLASLQSQFGDEADKLQSLQKTQAWVLKGLALLQEDQQAEEAFSLADLSKSVLLLSSIRTDKAYHFGYLPPELIRREKELQQELSRLKAALQERRPEAEQQSLQQALSKTNQAIALFKKQVEAEYPQYAALKYKAQRLSTAQVQKMLPPKTALLEYVIADKQVYILWVSNQEVNMTVQALPKDSLNRQIARLHRNLSHYEEIRSQYQRVYEEYVRLGHWFYVQLLQPVLSKSQGLEHLIIIPDGELSNLPFEAFLTEAPKPGLAYAQMPYLLRQYRISYSYSAGLWQENRQQGTKANNGQILAMAPSYPPADSLVFRAFRLPSHRLLRQKLSPLPSAKAEVLALSKLFAGHFAFDSLATEYQFKQGAERYAVIHLALHGLLDNQKPLLSALAFTEDGDSLENNLLQAYEISQMRFQANLVVLSACETGFGRFEQGNGTASLARAFMYAGLPALVVSLWQVNDASTAFIMEQFYRNLDQGMDKAKALQEAKLSYLQYYDDPQAAHPAFWASFIQLGDSSPIALQRKSSYWWWVWVGAAALLSFLGWLGWKRRR